MDKSESPIVVWFDTNAYNTEGQMTRELLQETLGNLMVFTDKNEYKRFLGRDLKIKRLVLIISGQLGKEIVPIIHNLTSILSIYVYCKDKKAHEEWTKQYTKVNNLSSYCSFHVSNFYIGSSCHYNT